MSKRRIEVPTGQIVIKRIRTSDTQPSGSGLMMIRNVKQETDGNSEWKENFDTGLVKVEMVEDEQAVENLNSLECGVSNPSPLVTQEFFNPPPNEDNEELNDARTMYMVQNPDDDDNNDATSEIEYTSNNGNVIVVDCSSIGSDGTARSKTDAVLEDERPLNTSMLILKDIDIATKIGSLLSLMQSTSIVGSDTVIREILLQDVQQLDVEKSLAMQCIAAKGRVQVEMELRTFADGSITINIVDIVRSSQGTTRAKPERVATAPRITKCKKPEKPAEVETSLRFLESNDFNAIKESMNIPNYFSEWTVEHVQIWLTWASQYFDLSNLEIDRVVMTGKDMFTLDADVIMTALGLSDPMFENHLRLLKELNVITVADTVNPADKSASQRGNRTGNNGQIQLWQFLLELLIDRSFQNVIRWDSQSREEGAFVIHNHNNLAKLWGQRKNKQNMSYEKMSRAMRYYYENNLIRKVPGKKYGYQFVCDLKQMIGYSPNEIRRILDSPCPSASDELQLEHLREMLRTPGGIKKVVNQLPDADPVGQMSEGIDVQEALGSDYLIQWDEVSN